MSFDDFDDLFPMDTNQTTTSVATKPISFQESPIQTKLRKFYAYQQRAYDWAIQRDKIALFMEMRLGKTMVSIRWAKHKIAQLKAKNPNRGIRFLAICPLSVVKTWLRELDLEGIKGIRLSKQTESLPLFVEDDKDAYFVTHYEAIRTLEIFTNPDKFEGFLKEWDIVICDESTKIRKTDAKVTQQCIKTFENVPYKAILSGFPAPESLLDYFTQYKFLQGEFMGCGDWQQFEYAYGDCKKYLIASKNNRIQAVVKENSYSLKRYECGIGSKKEYMSRMVSMPADVRKTYDSFQASWYYKSKQDNSEYFTQNLLAAMRIMQQMASGTVRHQDVDFYSEHKLNELDNLLSEELHDEKVVTWCNHVAEIDMILRRLNGVNQNGKRVALNIDGRVDHNEREKYRLLFQNPESHVKYLVCQLRCAGMGLDFSVADTAIYFSNSWEVEHRYQSEDRIIHPKKHVPILLIDLLTENTVDEDLRKALDEKPKRTGLYQEKIYTSFLERMLRDLPN